MKLRKTSRRDLSQVIEEAMAFFGPEGLGMRVVERVECCAFFMGGRGGHVRIQARRDGRSTMVEVVNRGWERPVQEFVERI